MNTDKMANKMYLEKLFMESPDVFFREKLGNKWYVRDIIVNIKNGPLVDRFQNDEYIWFDIKSKDTGIFYTISYSKNSGIYCDRNYGGKIKSIIFQNIENIINFVKYNHNNNDSKAYI